MAARLLECKHVQQPCAQQVCIALRRELVCREDGLQLRQGARRRARGALAAGGRGEQLGAQALACICAGKVGGQFVLQQGNIEARSQCLTDTCTAFESRGMRATWRRMSTSTGKAARDGERGERTGEGVEHNAKCDLRNAL